MSDLLIDLLAAGAVFIVFIVVFNKWQEHRMRVRGDAAFGSRHDDALFADAAGEHANEEAPPQGRIDPVLLTDDFTHDDGPAQPRPDIESEFSRMFPTSTPTAPPALETPAEAHVETLAPAAQESNKLPLDRRIDAIAMLIAREGGRIIAADALLDADWNGIVRTMTLFGERNGEWEALAAGTDYPRALAGLQLADRNGPLPGMELAAFAERLQHIASEQECDLEMESSETVLGRAAALDRLCAEADFQMTLEILAAADRPFPGTRIHALAVANGLELDADGGFRRSDGAGLTWFVLKNRGATPFSTAHMREFSTRALSLTLDVPRAPAVAFAAMRATALALCEAMHGTIADEQGHTLDKAALAKVEAQLAAIHRRLEASGIAPGGTLALRLFA